MSDDQGFEVVDKRRSHTEGEEEEEAVSREEPQAEAQAEPNPEQPAEAEPQQPEAEPHERTQVADVFTIVTWTIGILASSAWQKMGLQIDPGTGAVEKDLEQARVAIDCVIALADRVAAHLGDSDKRELRGIVSDLQMNFVNQSK